MNTLPPRTVFALLRRAMLALFFACLLLFPSSITRGQTLSTLSGRVTNNRGEPIVDATVLIYRLTSIGADTYDTETDENGEYWLTNIFSGTYRMEVGDLSERYVTEWYDDQPFQATADDLFIPAGSVLTGYDAVLADPALVAGKAVDPEGKPIGNVQVWRIYFNGYDYLNAMTTTNSNGEFSFLLPRKGPYYFKFESIEGRYLPVYYNNKIRLEDADSIVSRGDETITITATLNSSHTISGVVTDMQGQPVSNGMVELERYYSYWSPYEWIRTEEDGRYSFDALPHGEYRIRFQAEGVIMEYHDNKHWFEQANTIQLYDDGESYTVNAVLSRSGVITGTVTDIYGLPLGETRIDRSIEQDGGWTVDYESTAWTLETGDFGFSIVPLQPTNYRLKFSKSGFVDEYYENATTFRAGRNISATPEAVIPNINVMLRRVNEAEADFSGAPRTGVNSLTVAFANEARGEVVSQSWDFGDGITSTEISPTHAYTQSGVYTVALTVIGAENQHTITKTNYISITDTPVTALVMAIAGKADASSAAARVGETLHFSATSDGSGVEYLWDFGDEAVATAAPVSGQGVQHRYREDGVYTVTLTAGNSEGETTVTREITVRHGLLIPMIER